MADRALYTQSAALTEAGDIALTLADPAATPTPIVSKIRLFDSSISITVLTTVAELEAAETTLTGYPAGGYSVTTMAPALLAPGGGAVIMSNKINVVYASGDAVTIGGYWFEDPDGNVRQVFVYDPPRSLGSVGDGFPIVCSFGYGRNQAG